MSENTSPQPVPGIFGWNELITSDVEAAKKFYAAMFGWESETKTMAPGWDYTMFKKGETMVGGMFGITPEMGPVQPHWLSYVMSDDIEADLTKAKAAGGTVLKEAMEVPDTGTLAIIRDPQGAVIALWKCNMNAPCES
jgi:predicted enzyme related to lactoylglutathione lyase